MQCSRLLSPRSKVRDLSKFGVSIAPADHESWHVARAEMMNERKAGLKAKLEAELAAAADDDELSALRDRFSAEERALEHQVDHEVHTFSATIDIAYNVSSSPLLPRPRTPLDSCSLLVAVPGEVGARGVALR